MTLSLASVLSWVVMQIPVGTALTWALAKVAKLVHAKAHNEAVDGVLARINDAVVAVVKELQQTLVADLKAEKGSLAPEDIALIHDHAMGKIRSFWGSQGLTGVMKVLGVDESALTSLLSSKIEAAVHDLKAKLPAALNSAVN